MRLLRRALFLLGLLGLLTGLFAMHGLAPAGGTDVLAAGPHQHPAAPLAIPGPAHGPAHGLAAADVDPTVTGHRMPGHAMPVEAMPVEAMSASSGAPALGHGGHGSHLDGLCLAVLAGGAVYLLALALLGGRVPGAAVRASLRAARAQASALLSALRPPELVRLCVLRI